MRTPNYITTKEIVISHGAHDRQVIPAGASVRPVQTQYVPQHVLDKWNGTCPAGHTFVYCRFRFYPIPTNLIQEY